MLWQPEESWAEIKTDYESLIGEQYGYSTEVEKDVSSQTEKNASVQPQKKLQPLAKPAIQSNAVVGTVEIVGINRRIALEDINTLWQEFANIGYLQRAINRINFDIYAVYSGFNSTYSEADVAIGYDRSAMNDSVVVSQRLPSGKRHTLLVKGHYSNVELVNAWQSIDYRRGLVAVIEQRHYEGENETVSLSAIYQE